MFFLLLVTFLRSVAVPGPPSADIAYVPDRHDVHNLQVVLDRGVSWEQALAKRGEAAEAGMDEAVTPASASAPKPVRARFR